MKERILQFFKSDRTYKTAVNLYQEFGKRLSVKKQINMQSESDYLKGTLFDELRELADLSQKDLSLILQAPVVKIEKNQSTPAAPKPASKRKAAKSSKKEMGRSKTKNPEGEAAKKELGKEKTKKPAGEPAKK